MRLLDKQVLALNILSARSAHTRVHACVAVASDGSA
jgi:hypothetical protein